MLVGSFSPEQTPTYVCTGWYVIVNKAAPGIELVALHCIASAGTEGLKLERTAALTTPRSTSTIRAYLCGVWGMWGLDVGSE